DVALCPLDHSGECTSAPGLDRLDQVHDAQRPVTHIADDLAVDLVLDDRQQLSDADRVESEIFEQAKASKKVVRCLHIQLAKRESDHFTGSQGIGIKSLPRSPKLLCPQGIELDIANPTSDPRLSAQSSLVNQRSDTGESACNVSRHLDRQLTQTNDIECVGAEEPKRITCDRR